MSFDLRVEYDSVPSDLKTRWEQAFHKAGFEVEICPDFEPARWEGGHLPMKLMSAPEEMIGLRLPGTAVGGFEVAFSEGAASFRSASGRSTIEFAMMCIGAALLAGIINGTYVDPQSGESHGGAAALIAAEREVLEFVGAADEESRVHHAFPGWSALGVEL